MWSEETPYKYCKDSTFDGKAYEQLPCQKLCEADSGCVGIAWSSGVTNSGCYLCQNDILSTATSSYGFYRKPGNNEVHSKC